MEKFKVGDEVIYRADGHERTGEILEIDGPWVKILDEVINVPVTIHENHIVEVWK